MQRAAFQRRISGTASEPMEGCRGLEVKADCMTRCRRIAKATGGSLVLTLADMDGNESFDPLLLGTAEEVGGYL